MDIIIYSNIIHPIVLLFELIFDKLENFIIIR